MKDKVISILTIVLLIIGMLFSIKLPNGNYIGDLVLNLFGIKFSRILDVIVVLASLFIGQEKSRENFPKLNLIMRISFTSLVFVSLITNSFF